MVESMSHELPIEVCVCVWRHTKRDFSSSPFLNPAAIIQKRRRRLRASTLLIHHAVGRNGVRRRVTQRTKKPRRRREIWAKKSQLLFFGRVCATRKAQQQQVPVVFIIIKTTHLIHKMPRKWKFSIYTEFLSSSFHCFFSQLYPISEPPTNKVNVSQSVSRTRYTFTLFLVFFFMTFEGQSWFLVQLFVCSRSMSHTLGTTTTTTTGNAWWSTDISTVKSSHSSSVQLVFLFLFYCF